MKRVGASILLATIFGASAVALDPIEVRIEPGSFPTDADAAAHVRDVLGGVPSQFVSVNAGSGIIILEGNDDAVRVLRSEPGFLSVRTTADPGRVERPYAVLLDDAGLHVSPLSEGRAERLSDSDAGWPGEFVRVIARNASGQVVADGFVRDHRFVRFEGWNSDGSHASGSNRSFVDDSEPLDVWIALPAAAATIEIRSTLTTDLSGQGERLGHADITIEGAGR